MDEKEIKSRFTYIPPNDSSIPKFTTLRNFAREFALLILEYVPESREKSLAITKIEEAIFWANAGIIRNQEKNDSFIE